ncbi:MAG: FAD binding domain-containing protein [Gammaproteobacteria bacterium]|nr:FAD binding domain-containing protein [Gammaproteobacteria bacterium]
MKPAPFDYHSATSLDDAVSVMFDRTNDARVIAGGQSLVPMLNMRLLSPKTLVDISGIESLATIESAGSYVEVGANVSQCDLLNWPELQQRLPVLAKALPFVGHVQTRNRGTVCGSIAHADPSSELPLCLAVLDGEVVLQSKKGRRTLNSDEYQWGMLTTARRSDELITAVRFPEHSQCGTAFKEIARRHGDFANVALAATADEARVRLGVGGVADRPEVREWGVDDLIDLDAELNEFAWQLKGYDDIHATARYRRELVRRLGKQVIEEAISCRP